MMSFRRKVRVHIPVKILSFGNHSSNGDVNVACSVNRDDAATKMRNMVVTEETR